MVTKARCLEQGASRRARDHVNGDRPQPNLPVGTHSAPDGTGREGEERIAIEQDMDRRIGIAGPSCPMTANRWSAI